MNDITKNPGMPFDSNTRTDNALKIPVVTQNIPTDSKRIEVSAKGEEPTRQQLEQDVLVTNPSVESMESRG